MGNLKDCTFDSSFRFQCLIKCVLKPVKYGSEESSHTIHHRFLDIFHTSSQHSESRSIWLDLTFKNIINCVKEFMYRYRSGTNSLLERKILYNTTFTNWRFGFGFHSGSHENASNLFFV
jgi:hypothetical protein